MRLEVTQSYLRGDVVVPASKSIAHRALICAFLSGSEVELSGRLEGKDVIATSRCLLSLAQGTGCAEGAKRTFEKVLSMLGEEENLLKRDSDGTIILNASESGSTMRFLVSVVAALGVRVRFTGEGRLAQRPLKELIDTLNLHGADIEGDKLPITVRGRLCAGEYVIAGNISSQYITGLLMALPLLEGDSTIVIKDGIVSGGYIDITLSVLEKFGISIQKTDYGFYVRGGQKYIAPKTFAVEGDWSSAGFLLAAGALCGELSVQGLALASTQGDRVMLQLLQQAGACIVVDDCGVSISKSKLRAIRFDASGCPDIVPIMSIVLANAVGTSVIENVDRLRDKESDRLAAVIAMLNAFDISCKYDDNTLYINGGIMRAAQLDSFNDHRMAMSSIVGAMCALGKSLVLDAECIAKSYPDFVDDICSVGGNICEQP